MSNDSNVLGDVQNVNRTAHSQIGRNHRKHKNGHGGSRTPVKTGGLNFVKLHRVKKEEE